MRRFTWCLIALVAVVPVDAVGFHGSAWAHGDEDKGKKITVTGTLPDHKGMKAIELEKPDGDKKDDDHHEHGHQWKPVSPSGALPCPGVAGSAGASWVP